ncbi:MAG: hypothetical protein NZV14_14420 [Bryobacteraceae bacterium]|nr:hypothetical protein [Bryobacteraceae bacterium]MDW8379357.1 hypothetical protein [Bryobacterales bacterium]
MATLVATLVDRFVGRSKAEAADREAHLERSFHKPVDCRLRAFPNEDVYFFVKVIDNSTVVREADPATPSACWKTIAAATTGAVLLIGLLLPSACRLIAGYEIEDLRKQRDLLLQQKVALEMEEARLVSPDHLAELAQDQAFVDPDPKSVIHLPWKYNLAMNPSLWNSSLRAAEKQ